MEKIFECNRIYTTDFSNEAIGEIFLQKLFHLKCWRNNTMCKILALHLANLAFISTYSLLIPAKNDP